MTLDIYPNKDVVLEAASLINDPELFAYELRELHLKNDSTIVARLRKWQKFFLKKYINAPCIYSDMNFALIEAAKSDEIFKSQTTHEFELSLGFFQRLFNYGLFLQFNESESAKYLLKISLIFSKYPGMVIRPLHSAFNWLKNGLNADTLERMFETMFVKYESPKILIKHFKYLKFEDIEALMHIIKGNNIRTFEKLPFQLSKKESYLFINELPEDLTFEDSILKRAIVASKLLLVKNSEPDRLNSFLESSKIFETNVNLFEKDIKFWKQAFNLISKIGSEVIYLPVQEYVDFFEYKKYTEDTNYSLKGRTAVSITRAVRGMHEAQSFAKNHKFIRLKWKRRTEEDITIKRGKSEYLFKELTNGKELLNESKSLKHCVFTYTTYCSSGLRSIWSLQKKIKKEFKPYITIEVRNNSIVQLGAKHNRWLIKEETDLINEWAERMGFENNYVVY